jgi:8-oxo-dGTP pyrophosphatase MutT (NUDIX family)
MALRRIDSSLVYENRWMRVREDQIERADGSRGIYGVVEKDDFALIVPRDEDGGLWLVEQYRYPVGARHWEFPQGSWEESPGADRAALARGELREETGLDAGSLRHIGHLYEAYGFSTQGFDVWLATDLSVGTPERSLEEQDMRMRKVSREVWEAMVLEAAIKDAPSIAAYGLVMLDDARRGVPEIYAL